MVTKAIRAELLKLRKRSLTWILLGILIGFMALIHLLLYLISKIALPGRAGTDMGNLQRLLGLQMSVPFALSVLSSFGAVLAVILAASSIGNEYNWRTIRIALISSESRSKFLGAKLVSIGLLVLAGMVIGVATGFIMGLITTGIGGQPFDFGFATGSYVWNQVLQFGRTFFMLLPFLLLGFFFSLAGRSAMPGIAVGIGVLFLEPIISSFMVLAGGWVASVPNYLFNANVTAINSLNHLPLSGRGASAFGAAGAEAPSVAHAFVVLSAYALIFLVGAFYLFRKRDVTG